MQKGFTIIELMVTMVVLAILLGIGIPSYLQWIQNSRMDTATRSLAGVLKLARSEAVSRQIGVTVRRGTTLSPDDWATGAHVYTDADGLGNTAYDAAANDTLIKDIPFAANGITVATNAAGTNFVSFTGNGLLNEAGNQVAIALCDARGVAEGMQISVNLVGRISISNAVTCTP